MADLVSFLGWPFLACVLMGAMLGYLGIHVLKREVIFIDIAVAQFAAVGAIAAHILWEVEDDSWISLVVSLLFVWVISAFYAVARKKVTQISIEAVIGISYAIAAAGALFLIGMHPGHLHAAEMLAGNLLWVTPSTLMVTGAIFAVLGVVLILLHKPLALVSQDYHAAVERGIGVIRWDFLFYALLGTAITLAVRISGVVCVFAFLIMPATISAFLARSWMGRIVWAWIMCIAASCAGLLFAYYLDFSVGPPIALFLGVLLACVSLGCRIRARFLC